MIHSTRRPTTPPFTFCRGLTAACLALLAATPASAQVADATTLSLEQLLNVSVVGASKYEQKQKDVAAAVSIITRHEIKAHGWRTLADALASLPGVYTSYDRQYQYLGMRGFGLPGDFNTRVLLNVDGNRVNDAVFDQAYLGRDFPIDMDLIERVEFIPGPGGAVYGQNAMFGVVNVITRRGADVNGAELNTSFQSPQASAEGRVSWGKLLDNGVDALVSVSGMHANGEDRVLNFGAAGITGLAAGLDGERDQQFFARVVRGKWSSVLSFGDRRKNDPMATYLSDPLVPGQYQQDRHLLAQVQYQDNYSDDTLHLSARLFLGQERYTAPYVFSGTPTVQTGSSNWTGGELRLLSTAWSRHKFMFGMEYQANTRQDQSYEDLTNPAHSAFILGSGSRTGLYAQDEWTLGHALAATLGVRFDHNNATGNVVNPRVGLIWNVTPDTVWKALYGRAYRAPNVFEREFAYANQVADESLQGEQIDTLEFDVDHRVSDSLALRGSVYAWTMKHLVTLGTDPATGFSQYQNGQDVTARGLELSAVRTWTSGGQLRGSVSYQHPRVDAGNDTVPNSPTWLGKLSLSEPLAKTGINLGYGLQYSSSRINTNGTSVDGFWLSDLTVMADRLVKGMDLSLTFGNLFDTQYAYPGSRNNWQSTIAQDGRSIRLKLGYRF